MEITKYLIEKCDPENLVWIKVAEVERSISSYCVQKLAGNAQYLFRVIAENPIGESEPIESDPVTIVVKYGKNERIITITKRINEIYLICLYHQQMFHLVQGHQLLFQE